MASTLRLQRFLDVPCLRGSNCAFRLAISCTGRSPTFTSWHHPRNCRTTRTVPTAGSAIRPRIVRTAASPTKQRRTASSLSPNTTMDQPPTSVPGDTAAQLQKYSSCDISDALLKLKVPGAGFIADLTRYSPGRDAGGSVSVAPVSTVLFARKGGAPPESPASSNVPEDRHWADLARPGSFVVMKQPSGQTNAVCGGIMAERMKVLGVKGIAVAGRVRDLDELRSTELPILAYGTSTVGSGGSSVPWALQVPLEINGVDVNPGDIAFDDPQNGLVIIPLDKVAQVLEMLPRLMAADERVKDDVAKGMSVYDAFKLHRGT